MIVYMILFQWVQNKTLDPQLGALGYPAPDPTFIVHLETRVSPPVSAQRSIHS